MYGHDKIALASFFQTDLFRLFKRNPEDLSSNLYALFLLNFPLKTEDVESNLNHFVHKHEIFRTNFFINQEEVFQKIHPAGKHTFLLSLTDLADVKEEDKFEQLVIKCKKIGRTSYDLQEDPLLRVNLFQLSHATYGLFVGMHHAIGDGSTLVALTSSLIAREKRTSNEASSTALQFSTYSKWERENSHNEAWEKQLGFWKQALNNAPKTIGLPLDFPRPEVPTSQNEIELIRFSSELFLGFKRLALELKSTRFLISFTIFLIILHRITGESDVCVGVVANRRSSMSFMNDFGADAERIMGPLINDFILRSRFLETLSFKDFFCSTQSLLFEAFENSEVPFYTVVEELGLNSVAQVESGFQVMFDHMSLSSLGHSEESSVNVMFADPGSQHLDITAHFFETKTEAILQLRYNKDLFHPISIQKMLKNYEDLLTSILKNPDLPICEL